MSAPESVVEASYIDDSYNNKNNYKTALIPKKRKLNGPLSASKQSRFYKGYYALYLLGCYLFFFSGSSALQTFGAGLTFPGGGFVAVLSGGDIWMTAGHVAMFVATVIAFVAGMLAWILTGNNIAPVAVWLGVAALAPLMGHDQMWEGASYVVPGLPILLGLWWWQHRRIVLKEGIVKQTKLNAHLANTEGGVATPLDSVTGLPVVEELSEEDLKQMRFLLDRALQPVSDMNGFDIIDQFQTASIRYQICNMSYALSLANYVRMPAMRAYLTQAQQNLIEKMKEPKIWSYWGLENMWGNLRLDADPMAPNTTDNIMYSGWYAGAIAMYQSTTGDRRYNLPNAITLTSKKGKQYNYDYPQMVDILYKHHSNHEFCLFPCEPNWIYPMCNNYGSAAIKIEDRLNGTSRWDSIKERYHHMLDSEFTQVDGSIDVVRSTRIGFAAPVNGHSAQMYTSIFLHPVAPEIARRTWEIAKHQLLAVDDIQDALVKLDNFDGGNYKKANVACSTLAAMAKEMGDQEMTELLLDEHTKYNPATVKGGVISRKSCSTTAQLVECMARVGRTNGFKDLVEQGMPEAWLKGPILEEMNYPEILVAKAVSNGDDLDAVFYPGNGAGIYNIGLAQLKPNSRYQCAGASNDEVKADSEGRVRLTVKVDGRTPFSLTPLS